MELIFLGTGTSHGIPVVGCECPVCASAEIGAKNARTRTSVWIKDSNFSFVIDVTPEFRIQAIREKLKKIDFVLITHSHADHIHGLEDLRSLSREKTIPLYGNSPSLDEIKTRFSYIWSETGYKGEKPKLSLVKIASEDSIFLNADNGESFVKNCAPPAIGSSKLIEIKPVAVKHGSLDVLGYRIGDLAYITDCNFIPKTSMEIIKGSKILIIDALRYRTHPSHFSIDEAIQVIKEVGCEKAFFTHICHDVDHATLERELPQNIKPAYDGLKITFE